MWCTNCGQKLVEGARFCDKCGATQTTPPVAQQVAVQPTPMVGVATRPLMRATLQLTNQHEVDLPMDGVFLIGRGDGVNSVDLDLTDLDTQMFSSRRHAEIIARFGEYYIKDLGSRNGTFINDKKIGVNEEVKLHNQDRIILGQLELKFNNGA